MGSPGRTFRFEIDWDAVAGMPQGVNAYLVTAYHAIDQGQTEGAYEDGDHRVICTWSLSDTPDGGAAPR